MICGTWQGPAIASLPRLYCQVCGARAQRRGSIEDDLCLSCFEWWRGIERLGDFLHTFGKWAGLPEYESRNVTEASRAVTEVA